MRRRRHGGAARATLVRQRGSTLWAPSRVLMAGWVAEWLVPAIGATLYVWEASFGPGEKWVAHALVYGAAYLFILCAAAAASALRPLKIYTDGTGVTIQRGRSQRRILWKEVLGVERSAALLPPCRTVEIRAPGRVTLSTGGFSREQVSLLVAEIVARAELHQTGANVWKSGEA